MGYFKNVKKAFKLKNYANYIGVVAFLILVVVLNQFGMVNRSSVNLLNRIGYSIILAVSLNLVVGFLGELSLGHAGFMCVGAYIGCYFANYLGTVIESQFVVLFLSMLVGGLVACVFGFIIGLPALRLKGDYLAIATLAFGEIVRCIFKNLPSFGGATGLITKTYRPSFSLAIISFVTVLIMLIFVQNLIRSKHGRAITSIRDNEIAARAMGINVTFYKLFVFIVAAFFAGVAGVIYGHLNSPVSYDVFSYNYSIEILVMVVLGGMGSITGSILAASAVTFINFELQDQLTGNLAALKLIIYAVILIFMVLFNNAPSFKKLRKKLSVKEYLAAHQKKAHPEKIRDDAGAWDRIETKIKMDEILSVDISAQEPFKADSPEQGGNKDE